MAFHKSSFSRASQVIMPKDKTDSTVTSVEETIQTPVASGFSVFESRLYSLADSMALECPTHYLRSLNRERPRR